jgi:hypothetical protein
MLFKRLGRIKEVLPSLGDSRKTADGITAIPPTYIGQEESEQVEEPQPPSSENKARLVVKKPRKGDVKWLFKHPADREIQCLLDLHPGDEIFAPSDYRKFEKQFLEAIKEPIEFDPDDTPEEREIRQAVVEIREELLQRYNNGEDLRAIMLETQEELLQASEYRLLLKEQIAMIRRQGDVSPQDKVELIEAANTMLKEKGIMEIKCPALWKYQAERYLEEQERQ